MMMNDEELNKEADSGKSESAFYILFAIQLKYRRRIRT